MNESAESVEQERVREKNACESLCMICRREINVLCVRWLHFGAFYT